MSCWPRTAPSDLRSVALVVIDMQVDFCAPGGWVDQLGEGTTSTRNAIAPIARVLTACRAAGMPVVHTREGHEPGLHDLHANKQWRTRHHGLGIGDRGRQGRILVRGEPGWQIVPELAPDAGEHIVDKPGKDAFHQTDLDAWLREHGIRHLVITGVTSDCCVQSTLREAWDRGYEGLLLSDACAAVEPRNHSGMLALLSAWGGRFGAVTDCARFLQWLGARMAQVSA